jgi:HD-GYP domain-containing protein (c-di-GMP phosphodiesterase class II)
MVNTLLVTLAEKDQISGGHAKRLQRMCLETGKKSRTEFSATQRPRLFAQVHDLGRLEFQIEYYTNMPTG